MDNRKARSTRQHEGAKREPLRAAAGAGKLDGEVLLREFEAVEIADDRSSHVAGLEEFARELLDVFDRDAFEEFDQILRGEMAVEVHVVARQAVHALAAAFEREKGGAFEVIFGAAKLFGIQRLVAEAAKFIENRTDKLRSRVE